MLGINARVEDLREQLIGDINRAQMPACILDYVLTEILNSNFPHEMWENSLKTQYFSA